MTLRLRLFLLLLGTYLVGGWLIARWMVGQLRPRYFEAIEETLVETSLVLSGQLETKGELDSNALAAFGASIRAAKAEPYPVRSFRLERSEFLLHVLVADAEGEILYDSESTPEIRPTPTKQPVREEIREALAGSYGARFIQADHAKSESTSWQEADGPRYAWIHVAAPIYLEGKIGGAVSVGKSTASVEALLQTARDRVWWGVLSGGFILLLALVLGANWIIGPLERLADWARAVGSGKAGPAPPAPGRTLGNLRDALTRMRHDLAGHDAIDRYTRTLAHEIKAPLTGIRGAAEILLEAPPPEVQQRFAESIHRDGERIQHLVDELLALSRLQREGRLEHPETLDLTALCREAVECVATSFRHAAIRLDTDAIESAELHGDRRLLIRAIVNLLENARDFSPRGSTVRLSARRDEGHVIVRVEDEGAGIPEYACTRIFERFYSLPRPTTQQKSSGLGLNLVREIMELHRGEVLVANRPKGGVCAELRWPI